MGQNEKQVLEKRWKKYQNILNYTDEEMKIYRSFPKNVKVMEDARAFATHEIIVDIIEARNCISGYQVGDSFVVDTAGLLVLERCPPKICVGAVFAFKPLVDRIWEAFSHGGTECFHDTVRCPDVGVERGGAGEITMRIRAVAKKR